MIIIVITYSLYRKKHIEKYQYLEGRPVVQFYYKQMEPPRGVPPQMKKRMSDDAQNPQLSRLT